MIRLFSNRRTRFELTLVLFYFFTRTCMWLVSGTDKEVLGRSSCEQCKSPVLLTVLIYRYHFILYLSGYFLSRVKTISELLVATQQSRAVPHQAGRTVPPVFSQFISL